MLTSTNTRSTSISSIVNKAREHFTRFVSASILLNDANEILVDLGTSGMSRNGMPPPKRLLHHSTISARSSVVVCSCRSILTLPRSLSSLRIAPQNSGAGSPPTNRNKTHTTAAITSAECSTTMQCNRIYTVVGSSSSASSSSMRRRNLKLCNHANKCFLRQFR